MHMGLVCTVILVCCWHVCLVLIPTFSAFLLPLLLQDEASATQAMAAGATPASAVAAAHAAAGGAKQLSKCKHKACKLEFSTELNKHRCHMSHLPSARNATTKVGVDGAVDAILVLVLVCFPQHGWRLLLCVTVQLLVCCCRSPLLKGHVSVHS